MFDKSSSISGEGYRLHYFTKGDGPKVCICFHGFGQDASLFEPLTHSIPSDYTLYVFDLFFHGQSTWNRKEQVTKTVWKSIFNAFLEKETISSFELVGYSMGGRFTLATVLHFHKNITGVTLIAPDGIKTDLLYTLVTKQHFFRSIFKQTVTNPIIYKRFVLLVNSVGIFNPSLVRFANSQMDTRKKRWLIYQTWVRFHTLACKQEDLINIFTSKALPLTIYTGTYDRLISPTSLGSFVQKIPHVKFIIKNTGHNQLPSIVFKDFFN